MYSPSPPNTASPSPSSRKARRKCPPARGQNPSRLAIKSNSNFIHYKLPTYKTGFFEPRRRNANLKFHSLEFLFQFSIAITSAYIMLKKKRKKAWTWMVEGEEFAGPGEEVMDFIVAADKKLRDYF